jgi:hypothetical protein
LSRTLALGSLRLTQGQGTHSDHVQSLLETLPGLVAAARKLSG